MNIFSHTYYSSFSAEKTDISSQLDNTQKMIKDLKYLKKKVNFYQKNQNNNKYRAFHKNSIRSLIHNNLEYKKILTKEEEEKKNEKTKFYIPDSSKKNLTLAKINNTITYNMPLYNSVLSNNSLLSTSRRTHRRNKRKYSNNFEHFLTTQNSKPEILTKFNLTLSNINQYKYSRAESLHQFSIKNKEMIYSNYIKKLQENEVKKYNEGIQTQIELCNLEIYTLIQRLKLIKAFIRDEGKYFDHLKKTLKKETEFNELLLKKKDECFTEKYLLNHRLAKIERNYKKNMNNKFFLLCVKNGTNQLEKFSIEDQNDYYLDLETLNHLSNYFIFERKINEYENTNLSMREVEKIVFGRKLIREPRIIFNSPKEFKSKLNKIESNIQICLIEFNQTQNELIKMRDIYKEKVELITKDFEIDMFYKNELNKYYEKLNEVKIRNDYLKNYIQNIKFEKNKNKKVDLDLVDDKIFEMYIKINEKFPISSKRNFNETMNSISYLQDIERLINQLIKYKREQMIYNNEAYLEIKKNIEKENRIKKIKELKEKAKKDFNKKIERVLAKSNKITIKHKKKVDRFYINTSKKNKNIKKNNDDSDDYELY